MKHTPLVAAMSRRRAGPAVAVVPPLVAIAAQILLAPWVGTYVWFLLFPAIFVTSWIARARDAVIVAALTTLAGWWIFVPPRHVLFKPPVHLFGATLFFATGVLFVLFHERLRRSADSLEQALDRSRVFEAFLANSSDFIGIASPSGRPIYLNPAGRRLVALPDDVEVEATAIADFYPVEQRAFVDDVILKTMVERGQWQGDTFLRNWKTGDAIPVSDTHFVIREPRSNRLLGIGTITRDVSEMRRAQEAIELSNRRLERANDEITELYEKLATLDELKTQFFANVSHELRTPLTLILGPLETHLRAGSGLNPALRRDLEVVERNARTMLRHVTDLLDVARLDAGRLGADYADVDAADLVRGAADHFAALAYQHRIAFTIDVPSPLPVQTDAAKLQRMLLNLLSNAFKVTPAGGCVRISGRATDGTFVVEVADSGPGIPVDERETVFERFRQLKAESALRGGSGLGLFIVRDFAGLLGGRVSVGEAPEGGALFVLELPARAPDPAAVRADNGSVAAVDAGDLAVLTRQESTPAPTNGTAGRVLVVEDNADMSRFIVDHLTADGFSVSVVANGRDALAQIVADPPDLVLADVMMPVMTGDELVRELRRHPELADVPIVVLTAKADQALRVRLLSEGVQDYLDKPFSIAELCARVRNLVAHKHAEDRVGSLRRQLEAVAVASAEISEAVASLPEESVRTVFQTIALNAQNLTGAEFAAAGIGGDDSHPFDVWATVGVPAEQMARIGTPPRAVGLLAAVRNQSGVLRLRDARDHAAFRGFPPHHPEIHSFIGVPIRYRSHIVGLLFVGNKRRAREFTAEDAQVVEMLAGRAGAAVETARLYASEGRAHAWLQAVVDQMPEGIVLMDASGRITMTNQSLRALNGAAPPVTDRFGNAITIDLRRSTGEPVPVDEFPIVNAIVSRSTTNAEEFIARRADDRLVPLLVSAAPIVAPDGTLAGAAMIFQEISTLKELERLRQEWASIVAHDLKQPIGVIALRSSALLRQPLTDEQRRELWLISSSAHRLTRMVSDLMDASLLDARRMHLALVHLDLGLLVRDIVERVPAAASRTILHLAGDEPLFIKGDAQRLEQIVGNLLSNAVKYGFADTPIDVRVRRAVLDAEILVTNHGGGIPPEELAHIFDRYARTHGAKHSETPGLGLGLYIAKGLVEAHGGRIWADSTPGETTTFHVTLPLDAPPRPGDVISGDDAGSAGETFAVGGT